MTPFVKIQAATASEVCARFTLAGDAKPFLRDDMNPAEFAAALIANKKFVAAIDFLAHALPIRESVWWGCLCLQHAVGEKMAPPDKAAARAAVQWVMNPTETTGAAAKAPSEAAPPPSIAGALARAALQAGAGGSVASASAASAIKLAATKTEPVNIAKMQRSYVELGIEIAQGRFL